MSGQISSPTLLVSLADWLWRPVDGASRDRARLHLLDWMGCAVAGRRSPAGEAFAEAARGEAGGAVFFWGALGNVLEMDDVDKRALLHPAPTVVPAALGARPDLGADALLDAIVRGYEAVIRLGRAVGPGHYALWHNTGTCGPLGAAAAAASALDLQGRARADALALGLSQAAGFWQTRHEPGNLGKQLHTAHAARAGVTAATLAARGAAGPLSLLEGEQGFFAATCPRADPGDVLADHGADWLIHDVSLKPWPACRHAHAVIDAALLARGAGIRAEDVESIAVSTYSDALKFCDAPAPETAVEAKFSLQHSVAVALLRGAPTLEDFEREAIGEAAVAALRRKTALHDDARFSGAYPARFGGEVTFATRDGATHVFVVEDALGDPENPMDEAQIIAKARTLMAAGGLSEGQIDAGVEAALERPNAVRGWLSEALR